MNWFQNRLWENPCLLKMKGFIGRQRVTQREEQGWAFLQASKQGRRVGGAARALFPQAGEGRGTEYRREGPQDGTAALGTQPHPKVSCSTKGLNKERTPNKAWTIRLPAASGQARRGSTSLFWTWFYICRIALQMEGVIMIEIEFLSSPAGWYLG